MSLNARIRQAVDTVFSALDDVPQSATFRRSATGGVNLSTGAVTQTFTTSTVLAVELDYKQEERLAMPEIGPKDRKLIINATDQAFTPIESDEVTVGTTTYQVKHIRIPHPALWIIRVQPIT